MSRLILKSPYIKSGSGAGGYMKYIATRKNVQLVADDRPATQKQAQLICSIVKDFPDTKELFEYEDYTASHMRANASAFITTALELNWDAANRSDVYMKYIATRPRVEKIGTHGLFSDGDNVDLEKAMDELEKYKGRVWTHIISLRREDAVRLGYDNMNAWRNLLKAHRNDIAEVMQISPNNFCWYAAFHNEGGHPHVHMMAWSANPSLGYLTRDGIADIRSRLTNEIFKQEMLHLYEQKSASRDELVQEARKAMAELVESMTKGLCDHPEVEKLMTELVSNLESVTGKKQYGYLPKSAKRIVDEIVNQMERLPVVAKCYEKWCELQGQVQSYYTGAPPEKLPLSKQKEFRSVRNAVIREAERIRLGEITFEDEQAAYMDEPESIYATAARYRAAKAAIFGNPETLDELNNAINEMKALAESGYPYAQYMLGKMYRDRVGVLPDATEAKQWFTRAAEQDIPVAQYALGKLCLSDDAEVRDVEAGLRWLELAFKSGSHYAGYRLGKEYLKGEITEKNIETAVQYLTKSADQGNQFSQYTLGKLYLLGRDVKRDKELAAHWLTLSAAQGNQYAQFFLDRLDQFREPSVMLAATRLLHHMGQIFRDNSIPPADPSGMRIDSKRRRKLMEKKQALGQKDEPEQEQGVQFMGY